MKNLLTPPALVSDVECRTLKIPSSKEWLGIFNALLLHATYEWAWEQVNPSDLTPAQAASVCYAIFEEYLTTGTCALVPAPFWDDETDVDLSLPDDTQPWYGYVTDWLAPIESLDFKQNVGVWVLTGFVGYAAGLGAAIFFRTVARKFVLAIQRQDVGEIIRIIVDSAEYQVDTTPYAVGEIIDVPITTSGVGTHDIYMIKAG